MDRTALGLYASRGGERCLHVLRHLPPDARHGQLYGVELVLGLVAQQLQFRGTQIEEGGKLCVMTCSLIRMSCGCCVNIYSFPQMCGQIDIRCLYYSNISSLLHK